MRRYTDCDNASSTSSRAGSIPAATWEHYRQAITNLYATETLQQVRHRMEQVYAITATEQQYKRRITVWNIGKNVKSSEMKAIIAGQNESRLVRGRRVSQLKLRRYQHRVQRQQNELQSTSSVDDKTYSILQTSKPLGSPAPTTVTYESPAPEETRCNIWFNSQQTDSMVPPTPASMLMPTLHNPSSLARKEHKLHPTAYVEEQVSNSDIDHNQPLSRLLDVQGSVFNFAAETPLTYYEFLDPALDAGTSSNSAAEDTLMEEAGWDDFLHPINDEAMLSGDPMLQLATAWVPGVLESPAASARNSHTPAGEANCTAAGGDDRSIGVVGRWHGFEYQLSTVYRP